MQWLRQAATKLPYPLFLRLYLLKRRLVDDPRYRKMRRITNVPLLDEIDLSVYKKSDTVFIMGSGPSINAIPAERWQAIARHDSIGFNFWTCHPFVPTFYSFESIDPTEWRDLYDAFLRAAARRADDYGSIPKIVTELNASGPQLLLELPPAWRENLFTAYPVTPAARDEAEFSYALALLWCRGLFRPATRVRHLFKYASTLSALVALAVRMGYRKIILCGVDLTTQEYFYQDARLYPETAGLVPEPKEIKHLTFREFPWLVKMDAVLRQMRRQVLAPAGVELFVENPNSALWPEIQQAPDELFKSSELPPTAVPCDTTGKSVVK